MRTRRSTVLVTGGLGYIGSYVVHDLRDRGWQVRVLDNRYRCDPTTASELAALDGVEVVEGDIRYAHMVESATQGVEAVVHLAAVCMNKSIADPTESLDVNLMGTQNVLDAASRASVRRIVYASSASVYGNPTQLPMREDDRLAPITPYCVAKLAGEQMLDFYARRANLSWLGLRFFNVYGPGQPTDAYYTSVVVTFLNRLAAGEAPVIDGRGDQSMDFVHVTDVARSVGMALDSEATGLVLNVGTGRQTTIADLADMLIDLSGADVRPQFRPREVLVTQRQASIDRITETIGWMPRVDLEEGLGSVIHWLKARQAVA
jgi:UDP-glucose 4-epimerase